jgi:anti-sigma factor RsiW
VPSRPGISQAEAVLIEDHIRYLPSRERAEFQTSEGEEAARWFSEKLHFPVRAPEIPGGSLQGGRLCFLLGSRVALLFYEVQGRPLSFFVLDGESLDLGSARFEDYQGKKLCRASKSGYHLALWEEAGLVYAMVSDVPTDSLLRLAASL